MAANSVTTTDPAVNDDSSLGFAAGSTWNNLTTGRIWVCTDATAGAAVWTLVTGSGPVSLVTASGAAVGTSTAPLRTRGTTEGDILGDLLREMTLIRLILADALHSDLKPEDLL